MAEVGKEGVCRESVNGETSFLDLQKKIILQNEIKEEKFAENFNDFKNSICSANKNASALVNGVHTCTPFISENANNHNEQNSIQDQSKHYGFSGPVVSEIKNQSLELSEPSMFYIDQTKLAVSQILHELTDAVSKNNENTSTSLTVDQASPKCMQTRVNDVAAIDSSSIEKTTRAVRTSKRKRVPKKPLDEEKSQQSAIPFVVKEKDTPPESPVIYRLGDLVWSYVPGHPLWPCMLVNDPLESKCTKMQGTAKKYIRSYHVQFLGDSPEHSWVRETRVFPYTSPTDYGKIIEDLTEKSKRNNHIKVPRPEIPSRLKDDWDSGIDEILEAAEIAAEQRLEKYEYDFKPYMKEFKHLYSRRNKMLIYKECKRLLKDMLSMICEDLPSASSESISCSPSHQVSTESGGVDAILSIHRAFSCAEKNERRSDLTKEAFAEANQLPVSSTDRVSHKECFGDKRTLLREQKIVESGSQTSNDNAMSVIPTDSSSETSLPSRDTSVLTSTSYDDNTTTELPVSEASIFSDSESSSDVQAVALVLKGPCDGRRRRVAGTFNSIVKDSSEPKFVRGSRASLNMSLKDTDDESSVTSSIEPVSNSDSKSQAHSISAVHGNRFDSITTSVSTESTRSKVGEEGVVIDVKSAKQESSISLAPVCDRCSCPALSDLRGFRKGKPYTSKELVLAVEAILSGGKVQTAVHDFGVPRSTLRDYVHREKRLTVKHRATCKLFSDEVSALTYGIATHIKATKEHLCPGRNSADASYSSPNRSKKDGNPVVLLNRNDVIEKRSTSKAKIIKKSESTNQASKEKRNESSQNLRKSDISVPLSKAEMAVTAVKSLDSEESVSPRNSQEFEINKAVLNEAWNNCKSLQIESTDEKLTSFKRALNLVADGMETNEALCLFGLESDAFKDFVMQFLSKKPLLPQPTRFNVSAKSSQRQITVEPRIRKYTFTHLLQALDDLCHDAANFSINKTAVKYNIPYSSLKDCYCRNVSIIKKILRKKGLSKKERLKMLAQNADKLRISVFGLKTIETPTELVESTTDNQALPELLDDIDAKLSVAPEVPKEADKPSTTQKTSGLGYTARQLRGAMVEAQQTGRLRKSAIKFGIPASTLHNKLCGRSQESKKRASEEAFLVYMSDNCRSLKVVNSWGWSMTLNDVRDFVVEFLRDSVEWKYNQSVSDLFLLRMCQKLSITCEVGSSRLQETRINPYKLAAFTDKLLSLLGGQNMKEFPDQVYLLQEFPNFENQTPDNFLVFGAFNAAGNKMPPLVVFNRESVWCSYDKGYPGTQYALSESAKITPQIFEQWALRFLESTSKRPLVMLYDGELSRLTPLIVQKLYDSSCVVIKLPYRTTNTKLQLPYKNAIRSALKVVKQSAICPNKKASTGEIVSSVSRVWSKMLTSKIIRETFSTCQFLSVKPAQAKQLSKKLGIKNPEPVQFKPPDKKFMSNQQIDVSSSNSRKNTTEHHAKSLKVDSNSPKIDKAPQKNTKQQSEAKASAVCVSMPESSTWLSSRSRSTIQTEIVSSSAEKRKQFQCLTSPKDKVLHKAILEPTTRISPRRLRNRLKKLVYSVDNSLEIDNADNKLPTTDQMQAMQDVEILTGKDYKPVANDVQSFSIAASDDNILPASSTPKKSDPQRVVPVNHGAETNLVKSEKASVETKTKGRNAKVVDGDEVALDSPDLFESFFNKRQGPIRTERPELGPKEIVVQIRHEWEFLTPSKRLKYCKRPPEECEGSPKKRQKTKPSKRQKSAGSSVEPSAELATKGLSNQHAKTCNKSKEKPQDNKERPATNLTEDSQFKCSFQCQHCNDKFFSSKSLQIHKKFCTVKSPSPSKKGRIKQVSKESKVSKPQSPAHKSALVLNGTLNKKSLPSSSRRKKASSDVDDANATTASFVPQSQTDNGSLEPVLKLNTENTLTSPPRKSKARGRPQLGSMAKKENICIVCEEVSESPLLTCTAGCFQSVHLDCITGEKPNQEEPYKCQKCVSQSHPCFICNIGPDSNRPDLGKIKRCSVQNCGSSFHSSCLHSWKLSMISDFDDNGLHDQYSFLNNNRCPLHNCATCATRFANDPSPSNSARSRMFRCIRCPTAYHVGDDCIAAGSIILPGLNIICPEHFEPLKTTPHHQPVHVCWCFMCSKGGELMCCDGCPAAYHPSCVKLDNPPEGEWYCRDCRSRRKPLYGDIVWVKLGSYRWWPGEIIHPHDVPDNIRNLRHDVGEFVVNFFGSNDYFWLNKRRVFQYQEGDTGATTAHCSRGITSVFNKALLDASEKFEKLLSKRQHIEDFRARKKRPQYKFIRVNKPVGNVQVYTADLSEIPRCICKRMDPTPCGPESECLNRMLMFECHPNLCPAGDKCQNQHFQKRDYPTSEVFKTSWGGWGLKTTAFIKKGDFVNEYVGELVDNEECMRRIELAHKTNVTNFYMLTLDKDRIIDAGPKGNWSRFMNHSCDPSCETQKWTVNGDARVGLFARRDIQPGMYFGPVRPGEELTFNYNLDCLGNDKTPCVCGSKNCSGFIGVRPKPQLENKSSDQKVKKKRKRGEQRDLPKHDDFCFRCRQVGTLVCCDVRGCQRAFCLSCLRLTKPPFGKWECPWHHCDFCGRRAQSFCHFCPNSFCASHVMNQLTLSVPNQYDCCTDHDPNVAEYDMEEAIAAVVASMLPPESWEEETEQSSQTTEEVKEDANGSAATEPSPEKPKRRRKTKDKDEKNKEKPKRSQSKKKVVIKEEPRAVSVKEELLSPAGDEVKEEFSLETPAATSQDESISLTESDIELGPVTSSPVRKKRNKRTYFRGTKKRRIKSKAQKAIKTEPATLMLEDESKDFESENNDTSMDSSISQVNPTDDSFKT